MTPSNDSPRTPAEAGSSREPRLPGGRRQTPGPGGATAQALRGAIDRGETADKVPGSDPAAAPLGTDDEAAGTPPSSAQAEAAIRQETGRLEPSQAEPNRESRESELRTYQTTSRAAIWIAVAVVAAVVILALLLLVGR